MSNKISYEEQIEMGLHRKPSGNFVAPTPTVRRMSEHESAVMQSWAQAEQSINVEQAFQAQRGADERTSGSDRSMALVIRMIPLFVLWFILGLVVSGALAMLIEADATFSAAVGLAVFVWMSYNSYAGADERERYDSPSGVEHHRIDVAERLTEKKMSYDAIIRKEMIAVYLKQLEGPHDGK